VEGGDVYAGGPRKCLRFFYCMNGYHSGLLRVYVRRGDSPRTVRWQMYGDQLTGWRSADIELNITSVTEVLHSTATRGFNARRTCRVYA